MFQSRKLTHQETEDLKTNASYLGAFATNMLSMLEQLEEKKETNLNEHTLPLEVCEDEYARLNFFIKSRLIPTLKKANKVLRKNNLDEIAYQEKETVLQDEENLEIFLLRYYLSLENLKSPIKQLKIAPVKGFEFFDTLNYFQIKGSGEKIQLLSYYYVSNDIEKEKLNRMLGNETKKSTITKIEYIYNNYAIDKITGFSFNDNERVEPYNFNFDLDNFKDVLDRIKNKTNNVVNLK